MAPTKGLLRWLWTSRPGRAESRRHAHRCNMYMDVARQNTGEKAEPASGDVDVKKAASRREECVHGWNMIICISCTHVNEYAHACTYVCGHVHRGGGVYRSYLMCTPMCGQRRVFLSDNAPHTQGDGGSKYLRTRPQARRLGVHHTCY